MPSPFLGQIIFLAGQVKTLKYYLPCDGREMSVDGNSSLFSLLGTKYGGNGSTTFRLPDLRERIIIGPGNDGVGPDNFAVGQSGGSATNMLTVDNLPAHTHPDGAISLSDGAAESVNGGESSLATRVDANIYTLQDPVSEKLSEQAVANTQVGDSEPLDTQLPILKMRAFIRVKGIYPSRG